MQQRVAAFHDSLLVHEHAPATSTTDKPWSAYMHGWQALAGGAPTEARYALHSTHCNTFAAPKHLNTYCSSHVFHGRNGAIMLASHAVAAVSPDQRGGPEVLQDACYPAATVAAFFTIDQCCCF